MAFETKVLLMAFGEIVRKSKTREEIFAAVSKMANVEGVMLEPLDDEDKDEA